jgi:FkbH-like protein
MQPTDSYKISLVKAAREFHIPGAASEDIDRVVSGLRQTPVDTVPGLKPLRVQVLANITSDYLADHLRLMLVRAEYAPQVAPGHYGGLVRGLMGEVELTSARCDAAVLILSHRDLQFPPPIGVSAEEAQELVKREVDFWAPLLTRSRVPTAILSFDQPARRVLDEQDALSPGGLGWHVKMCNVELAARLPSTMMLVDAEALQWRIGAAGWYDERLYHLCKQPYTMEALPEIAHTLVAALQGLMGRARKVLVLDLDNTLWGGVIGDDGLQGIELGMETAEGEAFVAFQSYLRSLSQRGVILAVCSKNRDEAARSPFREHSGMVLNEEHISCFVANFNDKAANLRHIAKTLNLGLDSLVFVDDNPVERALIRAELPQVLVVELPDEPAYYARAVEATKAFPLRSLTKEDLGRVASYRAIATVRETSAAQGTDMEQFLIGLEPVAHVETVNGATLDRIVQLIHKTNQFKLNLKTFEEAEIEALGSSVIALRLEDRLQDHGIVAIAVTRPEGATLRVLNWVMSCRVFGRRLENVTLELMSELARQNGCHSIEAAYTRTEKNVILPPLLEELGFAADDKGVYHVAADASPPKAHHMKLQRKS